jgi:hypothetical protein
MLVIAGWHLIDARRMKVYASAPAAAIANCGTWNVTAHRP